MPRNKQFDEEEVLDKAMHLFWKQGFAATSVQDLVSYLGINRASLYGTYGDKEVLFKKAFERYRTTNHRGLQQFFLEQKQVKSGFEQLFYQAIDEAISDQDAKGCFAVNTTTELVPNDPQMIQVLEKNQQDFIQLFYAFLQKGKEDGQIPQGTDLKSLALMLYTFYNGIRVVAKVNPKQSALRAAVRQVLQPLKVR